MRQTYAFYVKPPLCRSIDYLYTASLCHSERNLRVIFDLADLDADEPYYLPVSLLGMENLCRSTFVGDLPVFGSTYLLDRIPIEQMADLERRRCFLFIDYAGEGGYFRDDIWSGFHQELTNKHIGPRQVVFINDEDAELMAGFLRSNDPTTPLRIASWVQRRDARALNDKQVVRV